MTNYVVIDLETFGHRTHKRFCNPLDADHYIVAVAYKFKGQRAQVDYCAKGIKAEDAFKNIDLSDVDILVAQNAKFDLLYLWKSPALQNFLRNGGRVFDTLQAEYLLRGQQGVVHNKDKKKGMSLDALALKYGGTLKDEGVKDVWANGGTVLDIPKDQLIEYAKYDVINAEIVLKGQLKQLNKLGMMNLIKVYNEQLLAVTEMEFNGMYFNTDKAMERASLYEEKLLEINNNLIDLLITNQLWPQEMLEFNLASAKQVATLLFGGTTDVIQRVNILDGNGKVVRFKSGTKKGQIKTKNEKVEILIPGLNETFKSEWETVKGGRGAGEDVLNALSKITKNAITKNVIDYLLIYRQYSKLISTYLYKKTGNTEKGLVPLVHKDNCVHSEYQTTKTETGRLSSTNPNLQNVPPSIIDLFESRFGNKGRIVELDFSQLEIIVLAYVTQCTKMIADIKNGVDFHCLRLSYAENRSYSEVVKLCAEDEKWKLKRKKAKVVSFQKSYGAHPKKIAEATGLTEDTINKIFKKEDERYPELKQYYDDIIDHLNKHEELSDLPLQIRENGLYYTNYKMKQMTAKQQSVTGKLYTFYKKAMITKRGLFQYWPMPNVMNYSIQGTAADVVAMQVGKVFRYMMNNRDKGLMINEIHDSVILDVRDEYVEEITNNVKSILEDVSTSFKDAFGLKFNVLIKVDSGFGVNWKKAK